MDEEYEEVKTSTTNTFSKEHLLTGMVLVKIQIYHYLVFTLCLQ